MSEMPPDANDQARRYREPNPENMARSGFLRGLIYAVLGFGSEEWHLEL